MLDGFDTVEVEIAETTVFARWSGPGPPVLLLHGFPETHLMWRDVAPLLARRFTVVCADLRGYGRPGSAPDHAPYAKRAMARDMSVLMERLGFARSGAASDHWVPGTPRRVDRSRCGEPGRTRWRAVRSMAVISSPRSSPPKPPTHSPVSLAPRPEHGRSLPLRAVRRAR